MSMKYAPIICPRCVSNYDTQEEAAQNQQQSVVIIGTRDPDEMHLGIGCNECGEPFAKVKLDHVMTDFESVPFDNSIGNESRTLH